ncbi:MAG: NADPH-dependent F420 reductase [Halobacteriota archaeon]
MRITLLGGTGNIGEGLALRWAPKHAIVIGSRSEEKAEQAAASCKERLRAQGVVCELTGEENVQAIENCDVVVVALPYKHAIPTIDSIKEELNRSAIVLSPVVPMTKDDFMHYVPHAQYGSAAMEIKDMLPDHNVVAAFHTTPAARLIDLTDTLGLDVLVCGAETPKQVIMGLVNDIDGLAPFDAGPLEASSMVESITPLLINVSARNKMKNTSIRVIGQPI